MVFIFVLHGLIVVGVLANVSALNNPTTHFLAVSAALLTLATLCVERGLRSASHLSRMRWYHAEISSLKEQLHDKGTTKRQLAAACHVETAARDELVEFIKEGHRARFLM